MYRYSEVKESPLCHRLTGSVTTVNDDISTCDIRASIASKKNISTLQLLGLRIAAHWDHAMPNILDLLAHKVGETSIDVAWRDGVDASEVPPFVGERAGQVDATGFGDVVGCLVGMSVDKNCFWDKRYIPVPVGSWQCDRTWTQ